MLDCLQLVTRDEVDNLTPSPPPPPPREHQPSAEAVKGEQRGEKGDDDYRKQKKATPYERIDSVGMSCRHGDRDKVGVVRHESGRRKKIRYFSSANDLQSSRGGVEESGVTPVPVGGNYPRVQMWRKRLGLMEGSVFTGSLPDLAREGESGEDGEGEEGEEGGEDEYIDPREIASAFIFPRLSRRVSQRVLRRMDTMINTATVATPTYLRIIGPDEEEEGSRALRRRELDRSAHSCCTTEDDLSSVDWDAGDEAPTSPAQNHTHPASKLSPAPADHTHRVNRVRRRRSNRMTAVIQQDSDDERIYECIDDLALPIGVETGGPKFQVPRKLTLPRRRSKVTSNRRQQLSTMKGLDGYEYLDLSPTTVEGASAIPRWMELSPALPPPRKTSAPVKNGAVEHVPIQPTLSVPVRGGAERKREELGGGEEER